MLTRLRCLCWLSLWLIAIHNDNPVYLIELRYTTRRAILSEVRLIASSSEHDETTDFKDPNAIYLYEVPGIL